uniref:Arthropsin n=1 Tax=Cupiennius salei TaxID=6928 RepID=T2I532_CUPSA|nr:arthropsin [Cupiennius salei]
MSLCDGSHALLESYGIFLTGNSSDNNVSDLVIDPVFRHWCYYDPVPHIAHYFVGVLLIGICSLSITGNLLVIVIFSRYRRLRSPANTLIINLATSDMLNGLLHPAAAYSSFKERWMFGRLGCEVYAGLCGLFGLISIVTLTAIAIERCLVISVKPWYGGILFTQAKAKVSIIIIWLYCFVIILPPLFGWGAFVPEGFLTSCSFDYISRTDSNRSYFIYIFILGFFLPVTIIIVCYAFITRTIFQNEKDMKKNNVKKVYNKPRKRNDYKAAEMIMFVIAMFLISWIPYSLIAFIGQFGNRAVLTPWVSVLPSLFAKMSTIYNPAIYGLSHRHFRATLRKIFKKERRSSTERGGTYQSRNSSVTKARNGCPCLPNYGGSDVLEESSSSFSGKKVYLGVAVANTLESNRILYIKKQNSLYESCHCELPRGRRKRSDKDIRFSTENKLRPKSYSARGRPAVLAVQYDTAKMSLTRSLMFKSESCLHQKYQFYLEKDHIVRIPSVICSFNNTSNQRTDAEQSFPPGLLCHVPKPYIRVLNIEALPVENVAPETIKKSDDPSRNVDEKKEKQYLCKDCILHDKLSHE